MAGIMSRKEIKGTIYLVVIASIIVSIVKAFGTLGFVILIAVFTASIILHLLYKNKS